MTEYDRDLVRLGRHLEARLCRCPDRELVCKATAKLLTNKVRNVTRPHQYAVEIKQGQELLHKMVSTHIAIYQDAAMASVDVKNAHGAVEWRATRSSLKVIFIHLVRQATVVCHRGCF